MVNRQVNSIGDIYWIPGMIVNTLQLSNHFLVHNYYPRSKTAQEKKYPAPGCSSMPAHVPALATAGKIENSRLGKNAAQHNSQR